jgi:putative NIF3 family GTP cyclohydrolase 1 type 2
MALGTDNPNPDVQSIAICAGSGGSMLLGVDADVYLTGEMSHVRGLTHSRVLRNTHLLRK